MADQTLARFVNERSILTLLRAGGGASRATISRALGLTPATISRLTADMLKRGLLLETTAAETPATEREPGRPGIGVAVNPDGAFFIGVEIGVGHARLLLLNLCAEPVEAREERLVRPITPTEAVDLVARFHSEMEANPRYRGKIGAGAVTVPGLVTTAGHVVNLPILGWRDIDFHTMLAAVPGIGLSVENNANAAAFGAFYTRPEAPAPCTVFLKLGAGCGGAAIVNGRLLRGADGTGMEPGHINIGDPGVTCNCGQRGCLETWVNLAALSRSYLGREPAPGEDLSLLPETVAVAHAEGSPEAARAVDSLAAHLVTGIVSLVNLFNPSQIILGGIMRPVLARCLGAVHGGVAGRIIPGTRVPEIRLSHLDTYECAIGAACLAHHRAFDLSNLELAVGPQASTSD